MYENILESNVDTSIDIEKPKEKDNRKTGRQDTQ